MNCKKCGHELSETRPKFCQKCGTGISDQTASFCQKCGEKIPTIPARFCQACGEEQVEKNVLNTPQAEPDTDESELQTVTLVKPDKPAKSNKNNSSIGGIFAFLLFLCASLLIYQNNTNRSLGILSFIAVAIGAYFVIKQIKNKNYVMLAMPVSGILAFFIILLFAMDDMPEAIKSIPGTDFIGRWMPFLIITIVISFVLAYFVSKEYAKRQVEECQNMLYSDSDLMLLNRFDRFNMIGYYILKAKLHGVITYERNEDSTPFIKINPDWSKEEVDSYCKSNPQVAKIISFIYASPDKDLRIEDIVFNVIPDPQIQSDGGKFATKCIQKAENIAAFVIFIGCSIAFYPGVTKLLLGILNEKIVTNLVLCLSLFIMITFGIAKWIIQTPRSFLVKQIISFKSQKAKSSDILLQDAENRNFDNLDSVEISQLLRAYVLHGSGGLSFGSRVPEEMVFSGTVFASIAAAHAIMSSSSSGSGCTSCSSCSSCGGGCGGCGGCGG